jgi:hypothetical protein
VSRPALGPTQSPVQWVPGVKARPGRDADQSPPSSAEVENEWELYLSPQARPWRVAGLLYLFFTLLTHIGAADLDFEYVLSGDVLEETNVYFQQKRVKTRPSWEITASVS